MKVKYPTFRTLFGPDRKYFMQKNEFANSHSSLQKPVSQTTWFSFPFVKPQCTNNSRYLIKL